MDVAHMQAERRRRHSDVYLRTVAQHVDLKSLEDDDATDLKLCMPKDSSAAERNNLAFVWRELQPLMKNPQFKSDAKATLLKLTKEMKREDAKEWMEHLPVKGGADNGEMPMPRLPLSEAKELVQQMFQRYSDSNFNMELWKAQHNNNPRTLAYCSAVNRLMRDARDEILPEFGLPAGTDGDIALAIAMGEHHFDADMVVLTNMNDEILYDSEMPMVQGGLALPKKQVLQALREMIAAFADPVFQRKLRYVKVSNRQSMADDCYRLEGRDEIVRPMQERILNRYAVPGGDGAVHCFFQMFAQYIMDPEVAAHGTAVNLLLGVEPNACKRFIDSLREIAVTDPPASMPSPSTRTAVSPSSWATGHGYAPSPQHRPPISVRRVSDSDAKPMAGVDPDRGGPILPVGRRRSLGDDALSPNAVLVGKGEEEGGSGDPRMGRRGLNGGAPPSVPRWTRRGSQGNEPVPSPEGSPATRRNSLPGAVGGASPPTRRNSLQPPVTAGYPGSPAMRRESLPGAVGGASPIPRRNSLQPPGTAGYPAGSPVSRRNSVQPPGSPTPNGSPSNAADPFGTGGKQETLGDRVREQHLRVLQGRNPPRTGKRGSV